MKYLWLALAIIMTILWAKEIITNGSVQTVVDFQQYSFLAFIMFILHYKKIL